MVLEVGMLALKDTSTSATTSTQATFSVRRPRAIATFGRFWAEEMGRRGAFSWGVAGKDCEVLSGTRCGGTGVRDPGQEGRERKECRLRGPDSVRWPRDREMEERTPNQGWFCRRERGPAASGARAPPEGLRRGECHPIRPPARRSP